MWLFGSSEKRRRKSTMRKLGETAIALAALSLALTATARGVVEAHQMSSLNGHDRAVVQNELKRQDHASSSQIKTLHTNEEVAAQFIKNAQSKIKSGKAMLKDNGFNFLETIEIEKLILSSINDLKAAEKKGINVSRHLKDAKYEYANVMNLDLGHLFSVTRDIGAHGTEAEIDEYIQHVQNFEQRVKAHPEFQKNLWQLNPQRLEREIDSMNGWLWESKFRRHINEIVQWMKEYNPNTASPAEESQMLSKIAQIDAIVAESNQHVKEGSIAHTLEEGARKDKGYAYIKLARTKIVELRNFRGKSYQQQTILFAKLKDYAAKGIDQRAHEPEVFEVIDKVQKNPQILMTGNF